MAFPWTFMKGMTSPMAARKCSPNPKSCLHDHMMNWRKLVANQRARFPRKVIAASEDVRGRYRHGNGNPSGEK
jgi:hypothetical protein